MYCLEVDIDTFEKMEKLLPEVWPSIQIQLLVCDYNLQRLGFVEKPLCRVQINLNPDERESLMDKLMDYEIFVYNHDFIDEKSPEYQDYCRYIWLWDVLGRAVEC